MVVYQSCVIMLCVTPGCSRYWRQDAEKTGHGTDEKHTIWYYDDGEMDIFLVASHHYEADTGSGNTQNTPWWVRFAFCMQYSHFSIVSTQYSCRKYFSTLIMSLSLWMKFYQLLSMIIFLHVCSFYAFDER